MDLTPFVEALREELAVAAEAGGPEARALADRLTAPLESAVRLALLDALAAAAGEITRDLAPGSVDVRLRGREPSFVVTPPPAEHSFEEPSTPTTDVVPTVLPDGDDTTMTRINLRLAQDVKDRVEEAARASGLSVNAWLVRAAVAALNSAAGSANPRPLPQTPRGGDHYTGWVR